MKFIHFLYENDYKVFSAQNLSLLQNERSFFSKFFRQHKKAEDVLFRFVFYYAILSNDFFVQPFPDYLFLCKKSGIFKDLVATLERKSAGGFWMPLNA